MHPITLHTAEHYTWGQNCDGWHLVKRDEISVIQERVPTGGTEVLHFHEYARSSSSYSRAKSRSKRPGATPF